MYDINSLLLMVQMVADIWQLTGDLNKIIVLQTLLESYGICEASRTSKSVKTTNVKTTNVKITRATTTRVSKSSQFHSLSNKAVHGSTSSDHHHQQQLSSTVKVSRIQYQESSFNGLSTKAVHGSQFQTNSSLTTKAVHGSRSGNNIKAKPPVQLQQHHRTSQSSRLDGLSTKAVHGSKSGTIKPPPTNHLSTKVVHGSRSGNIKPPPVRQQQHHGTSQLNLFVGLSTKAVHGSTSCSVRASSSTSRLSRFDGFSTTAVCDGSKFRLRLSSLNRLQRHHQTCHEPSRFGFHSLSTRAVHGSRSNIKPPVRLQQHLRKSLPSLIDGLTTRVVHGSRSGNIKPPPVRQQPRLFMAQGQAKSNCWIGCNNIMAFDQAGLIITQTRLFMARDQAAFSQASRTSNHQNQSQDPYNQKHKSYDQLINRHHHQHRSRWRRTSSEYPNQSTNVNTTRAATTRASKSSQLDSLSNKAVHGSTSSDHHQQLSSTSKVSRTQYPESSFDGLSTKAVHGSQFQTNSSLSSSSTSSSQLSRFDGLSTMAVSDHRSIFRPRINSLIRRQQQYNQTSDQSSRFDGLSTKAVHGSRSGSNIKPPVRLQQRHGTSQSSRFDGLSNKAVHGSRSGTIKPQPFRRQQHHGTSQLSLFDGLSTRAVHGSTSYSVRHIVFRNIKLLNILFDEEHVVKPFDFCLSVTIPEGETHIKDEVIGAMGFFAPEYKNTDHVKKYNENGRFEDLIDSMIADDVSCSERIQYGYKISLKSPSNVFRNQRKKDQP
ncbi:hypothetical protein EZV62_006737 [Acer yangbiense]|uniref:Protein kinase domain-containing protein n=1 Tax=Acer yangbiense TaxID=1000413 RepID=A0A5C7I9U5_9ROSI|nr:hypothetical protein EZV62_006737 [Acer yangbiense]